MKNLILLVLIVCVSVLVSGCQSQESKTVEALEAAGVPDAQAFYDYLEPTNGDFKLTYVKKATTLQPLMSLYNWDNPDATAWCIQIEPLENPGLDDAKGNISWIVVRRENNKWVDAQFMYMTALKGSGAQRARKLTEEIWQEMECLE